ncbi:hypothetical protein CJF32_00003070 [Rutstroemia sp. NJR-2017a WRK4]|nr:hypothetical protein CJF32_00003070 [Rutstroemia sp. NJR-2017a WRK4]
MSDEYDRSPYRESSPPLDQSASEVPLAISSSQPKDRPRQYSRSALRRRAFLCNLLDSLIPNRFASEAHVRHRSVNGFHPNMIESPTALGGLRTHEEVDEWVIIHDTNYSSSGPADVRVPATLPPSYRLSPGFEIQRVVGGAREGMKSIASDNVDLMGEILGPPGPSEPRVGRADAEKPEQTDLGGSSNLEESDWNNNKWELELNEARTKLLGPTFKSDDGNSNLIVSEIKLKDETRMRGESNDSLNEPEYETQGMDLDDTYEDEEEFDEEAWIASYN